jgi:hypothetical protein
MGAEAKCAARLGKKRATGKALLETAELIFRSDELRLKIPFAAMKKVEARGDELHVTGPDGLAIFELGAAVAARWARKITNPPTLLDKLGVAAGQRVLVAGAGHAELAALLAGVTAARDGCDAIFFGAEREADLAKLPALARKLAPAGALWVIRPKGVTAITEKQVLAAGKAAGLVDVKVVAFSPTHTAEKFVIPRGARAGRA